MIAPVPVHCFSISYTRRLIRKVSRAVLKKDCLHNWLNKILRDNESFSSEMIICLDLELFSKLLLRYDK